LSSETPPGHGSAGRPYDPQDAAHYARLYKAHNPKLRFRYRRTDEEGEPDDSKPVEVDSSDPDGAAAAP